jgi:hypothetical protein
MLRKPTVSIYLHAEPAKDESPHSPGAIGGFSGSGNRFPILILPTVVSPEFIHKKLCHSERSWARFLRPTESKNLRLHFGNHATNFQLRTLAPEFPVTLFTDAPARRQQSPAHVL